MAKLRDELQQKCCDMGVYWRASDAHGVDLTVEQATELLRDALGVEVEIKLPEPAQPAARCPHCDGTGDVHSITGEWRGTCNCPAGDAVRQQPAASGEPAGWICRHKQQVTDAEKIFPGQPHDHLWKYTHGARDMAATEAYGDFDVVRLYAAPHPAPRVAQPLDYTALVEAAHRQHGYAQGTSRCIAFKHGAEWAAGITRPTE